MQSNRSDLPSGPVLPLQQMQRGETGEIFDVRGGRGVVRRLTELGLAPGVKVRMVSDSGSFGPVIVQAGETKIGIGRGMARRVLVRQTL
ncbi:MAG: FeoA family protein [Armatimonadota bacterium]